MVKICRSKFDRLFHKEEMRFLEDHSKILRVAREIIKRKCVLVYNFCYHGTVDETYITITEGVPALRRGNLDLPVNPVETMRVIESSMISMLSKMH